MKKTLFITKLALYGVAIFAGSAYAVPDLKLPFPEGESWTLTRGYEDTTHKDYGGPTSDDRYALDFVEPECDSLGKSIIAAASGLVHVPDYSDGYGNAVIIDHGDGCKTRYAHLDLISVIDGQSVVQGQHLGTVGNTGNVSGTACSDRPGMHLHFALYCGGVGVRPEPMSGYAAFTPGLQYTSDNMRQVSTPTPTPIINATTPYFCDGGLHNSGAPDYVVSCNRVNPSQGYTVPVFYEGDSIILNAHYTDVHGTGVILRVFVDRDGQELSAGIVHSEGPWDYSNEPHTAYVTPIVQNAQLGNNASMAIYRFYVCLQQEGETEPTYDTCKGNPDFDSSKTVAVLLPRSDPMPTEQTETATGSVTGERGGSPCPPAVTPGTSGWCTSACPCNTEEGPCTSDGQCANSLVCDITASTPSGVDEGVCRISTTPVSQPSGRYTVSLTNNPVFCGDEPYPGAGAESLIGSYQCNDVRQQFYRGETINACFFVDDVYEDIRFDAELWCNGTRVDIAASSWQSRAQWAGERVNMTPHFDTRDHYGACSARFFVETLTQPRTLVANTSVSISSDYPPLPPTASPTLNQEPRGGGLQGYIGSRVMCLDGIRDYAGNPEWFDPLIPIRCTVGNFVGSESSHTTGTAWHFVASGIIQDQPMLAVIQKDGVYVAERRMLTSNVTPGTYAFAYMGTGYNRTYYAHGVFVPQEPGSYSVSWYVFDSGAWHSLGHETQQDLHVSDNPVLSSSSADAGVVVQDAAALDTGAQQPVVALPLQTTLVPVTDRDPVAQEDVYAVAFYYGVADNDKNDVDGRMVIRRDGSFKDLIYAIRGPFVAGNDFRVNWGAGTDQGGRQGRFDVLIDNVFFGQSQYLQPRSPAPSREDHFLVGTRLATGERHEVRLRWSGTDNHRPGDSIYANLIRFQAGHYSVQQHGEGTPYALHLLMRRLDAQGQAYGGTPVFTVTGPVNPGIDVVVYWSPGTNGGVRGVEVDVQQRDDPSVRLVGRTPQRSPGSAHVFAYDALSTGQLPAGVYEVRFRAYGDLGSDGSGGVDGVTIDAIRLLLR